MTVVTRFAPSPTGYLHIGGARTALFNYLFAKHFDGKFLLRIEDTDKERSTQEAVDALLDGLSWLGINWDGDTFYQSHHLEQHKTMAHELVQSGHAYYCYLSQDELQAMRDDAQANNTRLKVRSPWRSSNQQPPQDIKPVVRFKAPDSGVVSFKDHIQGDITIPAEEVDDFVLLRADGSPVYMLAVVSDDHEMGVTHIIRGDDHLTNTAKQVLLFKAMGWKVPEFAHIPLIHGPDGAKLSKRHGALGAEAYRDLGYLPQGLCNYLLRLGWSHGDDEIISPSQAIEWFDLDGIGKSPSRFDFAKLDHINHHYIQQTDVSSLLELLKHFEDEITKQAGSTPSAQHWQWIESALPMLQERSKTLVELAANSAFLVKRLPYTDKALKMLDPNIVADLLPKLEALDTWQGDAIKQSMFDYAEANGLKLGKVMPSVRAGVCGTMEAPDLTRILEIVGKEETLARLSDLSL